MAGARTESIHFIRVTVVQHGFAGIFAPGQMRPMLIGNNMQNIDLEKMRADLFVNPRTTTIL
jgi:hypothetical protein